MHRLEIKEKVMKNAAMNVVRWEKSLERLNDQLQNTYKAIADAKDELAAWRKAARDSIQIEKTRGGFKMTRGDVTLMVRRGGRYRDFNAYLKGKQVASYGSGYDMQTDFAMGRLAGFDVK
jgi:hypothetical protein